MRISPPSWLRHVRQGKESRCMLPVPGITLETPSDDTEEKGNRVVW
jgi:hypothetical protein